VCAVRGVFVPVSHPRECRLQNSSDVICDLLCHSYHNSVCRTCVQLPSNSEFDWCLTRTTLKFKIFSFILNSNVYFNYLITFFHFVAVCFGIHYLGSIERNVHAGKKYKIRDIFSVSICPNSEILISFYFRRKSSEEYTSSQSWMECCGW